MFRLTEPSSAELDAFLRSQRDRPFSYPDVGITQKTYSRRYTIDHNRIRLGEGAPVYASAVDALRRWRHFRLGWLRLFPRESSIEPGATVAILVRLPGIWSLNACRVVYRVEEQGEIRRFGFAYGTLSEHVERGEERFTVEWRSGDDSVWYDILAFSRPAHVLARIGYPFARGLQRRFARDSKQAMMRTMLSPGTPC